MTTAPQIANSTVVGAALVSPAHNALIVTTMFHREPRIERAVPEGRQLGAEKWLIGIRRGHPQPPLSGIDHRDLIGLQPGQIAAPLPASLPTRRGCWPE